MHFDAIERRDAQRAQRRADVSLVGASRLPDVLIGKTPCGLAAPKILVDAFPREAVEARDGGCEPHRVDLELACKFLDRIRTRYSGRHLAAARRVDEGEALDVLLIE